MIRIRMAWSCTGIARASSGHSHPTDSWRCTRGRWIWMICFWSRIPMPDWRFGTMGFGYADWNGVFYPAGTKSSDYLAFYARHFNSVELDTTFYATPEIARVKHWAASVPDDFRFTMKTPRTITHEGAL